MTTALRRLLFFCATALALCCSAAPTVSFADEPRITGVFLEIYEDEINYSYDEWARELAAMRAVGINQVIVSYVLNTFWPNYTVGGHRDFRYHDSARMRHRSQVDCTLNQTCNLPPFAGCYAAFYPTNMTDCVYEVGAEPVKSILDVATATNMTVWIGLAVSRSFLKTTTEEWDALASLQISVMGELWRLYGHYDVWKGVYSVVEVGNENVWQNYSTMFAQRYLQPVSAYVKSCNAAFKVFGSPYMAADWPGHMNSTTYAQFWSDIFVGAPDFDFIAPQDGAGAFANDPNEIADYLQALGSASHHNGRVFWSNAEIWHRQIPQPTGASCVTRRPADWQRILAQFQTEVPLVEELIVWEWHSYLSPFAFCPWKADAVQLYKTYSQYVNLA